MRKRLAYSLMLAALLAASPAYAADEKPAGDNRIERAAKKTARGAEKTAKRVGKWAERTGKRAGKAVGRAADKTENWVRRQTE